MTKNVPGAPVLPASGGCRISGGINGRGCRPNGAVPRRWRAETPGLAASAINNPRFGQTADDVATRLAASPGSKARIPDFHRTGTGTPRSPGRLPARHLAGDDHRRRFRPSVAADSRVLARLPEVPVVPGRAVTAERR